MKKILIFTDSRGNHKQTFSNDKIFTEKIYDYCINLGYICKLILCPYPWTTTFDFIANIENKNIQIDEYDLIILYVGVVEFSPRPYSNFIDIYNNKKLIIEKLVPTYLINNLINNPYNTIYKNEKTYSLISINIFEKIIIPYLQKFNEKLIYINTNNIVENWEGNYLLVNKLGRPKNINIISEYSKLTINKFDNIINLLEWNDNDIQKYTVDNMHLTYEGSEWIYNKIIERINSMK